MRRGLAILLSAVLLTGALVGCAPKTQGAGASAGEKVDGTNAFVDKTTDENAAKNTASAVDTKTNIEAAGDTAEYVVVRFYDANGGLLKTDSIAKGGDAVPPEINFVPQGYIFDGWDLSLYAINSDTDIKARYSTIKSTKNVISFSPVYTEKDGEFTVDVEIGGEVSFCYLKFQMTFDTDALEFVEITGKDAGAACVYDKTGKKIGYSIANGTNINANVDLCSLRFKTVANTDKTDLIKLSVVSISELDANGGFADAQYSVINGNINIK